MKTHKWTVQTEDGIVSVEYSRRWNDTEYALLVNGKQHHMQSREAIYIDIDYEFNVGKHLFNFVAAGIKCDLAVDGVFLNSKLPYQKRRKLPIPSLFIIMSEIIILLLEWVLPIVLVHRIILWAIPCTFLTCLTIMMTNMLGKAPFARPKDYLPRPLTVTFIELGLLITMLIFFC